MVYENRMRLGWRFVGKVNKRPFECHLISFLRLERLDVW